MEKPSTEDVNRLVGDLLLPVYEVQRDMALPFGDRRDENVAEHSWSVGVLACSLAPEVDPSLDVGLVAQLALAHDIIERHANDTSVWSDEDTLASKEEREAAALHKIIDDFSMFPWLGETITVYERCDRPEAHFVKAVDKLIASTIRYLDEGRFYRDRGIDHQRYIGGLVNSHRKAHLHPGVGVYYDRIRAAIDAHPEWFPAPTN